MTEHPIKRILEDGTRVYANRVRYKPKPLSERKYAVRKIDDPRAFRWKGDWFLPLEFLEDDQREPVPETRPDTDAYDHMTKSRKCRCYVCLRPESQRWKDQWRKDQMRTASP